MSGKMIEIGSRIVRHSRKGLLGVLAIAGMCMMRPAAASGQLIESFENTLDGWTFNPSYNTQNYTSTFSTTTGVTNGSDALQINSGPSSRTQILSGFNYGALLTSPRTAGLAATLANASAVTIDFFAPSGALGYGPQIDLDIDDGSGVVGGTGFTSTDGYSYPTPTNGVEVTQTYPISAALRAELAIDAASTGVNLVIQAGSGTPTNATSPVLYIDNIVAVPVPEPASLGLLALGASSLMMRRRKA
jgi:PEP-CTERM motif